MDKRSIQLTDADGLTMDLELLEVREDGKKVYRCVSVTHVERGILPGIPMLLRTAFTPVKRAEPIEGEEPAEGEDPWMVEGIASSTSEDWYGTEMSLTALADMSDQMDRGVALTPRHNSWYEAVEWDEVIGISQSGLVEKAAVINPSDPKEQGYTLTVTAKLYEKVEKAQNLRTRLSMNQPIGLSIGGWFLEVNIIANEKDEVERVIIDKVLLDHFAVTRAPANPDSSGLKLMRSMAASALSIALKVGAPEEGRSQPEALPEATKTALPSAEEAAGDEGDPQGRSTSEGEEPSNATTSEEEMDAKELRTIMQEQLAPLSEGITELSKRVVALEERGKEDPTKTKEQELQEQLDAERAKNEHLENRLGSVVDGADSGRRSLMPSFSPEETDEYDTFVERAKVSTPQVSRVCGTKKDMLIADPYDPKIKRSHCTDTLGALCRAAVADGLISDPTANVASWN